MERPSVRDAKRQNGGYHMKKFATSIALMALVSACATPYRPIPFDHATSGITSIQVVEDAMPPKAQVRKLATNGQNMASAASSMGLAGLIVGVAAAGIEASVANDQNNKINATLAAQHFDAEAVFDDAFEAELKAQNYEVSTLNTPRDEKRSFVVVAAQPDARDGSAVLDVNAYGYGYQLVGGTKWRPYVVLAVKMYDAKTPTKVLLDNQVEYNAVNPGTVTISIPGDETYGFDKVDDIQANPEKATEGLTKAIQAAAHATAQLLK